MTELEEKIAFAARLTQMRVAAKLSQKQLAARVGCRPYLISRYERGLQLPRTPEAYVKLSAALAVRPDELLGVPPAQELPADPRLAVRVQALGERLGSEKLSALLAILDAALAVADGGLPSETFAPREPL